MDALELFALGGQAAVGPQAEADKDCVVAGLEVGKGHVLAHFDSGLHVDAADGENPLHLFDRAVRPHLVGRHTGGVEAADD